MVTVTVPAPFLEKIGKPVPAENPTQRDVAKLIERYDAALDACNTRLDDIGKVTK